MRIRDHDKADLALAALTLTVTAAAAVSEAVQWGRRRRGPGGGRQGRAASSTKPSRSWRRPSTISGR